MACTVFELLSKDPNYQEVKSWYNNPEIEDYKVEGDLWEYRLYHDVPDNWMPSADEKEKFLSFVRGAEENWSDDEHKKKKKARLEVKDAALTYLNMLRLGLTRAQAESRVNYIKRGFTLRVNAMIENEAKKGNHISVEKAIRRLGGYKGIMRSIFNGYKKTTPQEQYDSLVRRFGEPKDDAQKAKLMARAEYISDALHKMADNESRFSKLASRSIGKSYGLVFDHSGLEMNIRAGEKQDEQDAKNEDTGTQGERYIDTRTLHMMDTISTECKVFLSDISALDLNGKRTYDDMLQPKLVEPEQIAYVLPEILRNSTPETMMEDIRQAVSRYPYLRGLYQKLINKNVAKDRDARAMIFTFFKKARNIYTYANRKNGGYRAEKANTKAQGNSLTRRMAINMHGTVLDQSGWSLYDNSGLISENIKDINEEVQKALSVFDELGFVNMVEGGYDRRKLTKANGERTNYKDLTDYAVYARENGGDEALKLFFNDHPDFLETVLRAAHGVGLDITEQNLRDAALAPISKKAAKALGFSKTQDTYGGNRLQKIVNWIRSTYNDAASGKYESATALYNSFDKNYINDINYALGVAFFDELDPRIVSGDSQLSTYTYPNLIHETMDLLNNEASLDEENYRASLKENFLRFRGYALNGKPTGWLKRLFNYPPNVGGRTEENSPMELYSMTQFDNKDYEELSLPEKFAAQITMYANPNLRAIEANIMSDYTGAWHFIKNAGLGRQGASLKEMADIRNQRKKETIAYYKETHDGAEPDFADLRKINSEITREVTRDYSFLKKLDGSYHTEWAIVRELVDETLIEYERIKQTKLDEELNPDGLTGPYLKTQRERGKQFLIFPEFNSLGVEAELDKYLSEDGKASDYNGAEAYLANLVADQLQKVIDADIKYIESIGALKNKQLKKTLRNENGVEISLYQEDGRYDKLNVYAQSELQQFFLDTFYGRVQAAKILNGGLENFKGVLDYEKRNMMLYSPARPLDTRATWNGVTVGRENQRAVYLGDEKSDSKKYKIFDEMFGVLQNQGLITEKQRKRMAKSYNDITTTDGQAFRTYESYRVVQIELGKWSDERENVYQYLVNNKGNVSKQQLAEELSTIYNPVEKPRYAGWEILGDRKIPVLHKYAETVLFPSWVMEKIMGKGNVPTQLMGMAKAAEKYATTKQSIDIFLFDSCVKVGGHSSVRPFGFVQDEETGKDLVDDDGNKMRICQTADEIANFISASIEQNPWTIHTLPMKYYGEAASTPAHTQDDEISWSSQAEKNIFGNLMEGDKIKVGENEIDAETARSIFDDCNAVSVIDRFKKLRKLFRNEDELRLVLMDELGSKSYSNPELEYALSDSHVPLFFPSIRRGAEQIFLSMIKKRLTRPKTKGANVLQVTSFGYDVDPFGESYGLSDDRKLEVHTEGTGEKAHIKYIDAYITLHDSRLEPFADEYSAISPERLQQLVNDDIIPEDLLRFVAYRTPSDDIHSVLPLRIKGFLPKTFGANIVIPKEVMNMTGHDFDGDKLRCHFQEFKIDFGEEIVGEYNKYKEDSTNIVQTILSQNEEALISQREFRNRWAKDVSHYKPGTISMYQFDYSKPAYDAVNGQLERDNAKVQLAFAMLTSPAGSRRLIIPGGSAETDVMGAAFEISRKLHSEKGLKEKMVKAFPEAKLDLSDNASMLESLLDLDGKTLGNMLDFANGSVTPFPLRHSLEAFNYIIGGKRMIDIYALHSSAAQLLQRVKPRLAPITFMKDGKQQVIPEIGFFGKPIDELFKVKNNDGFLGSLFMSEGVNSAVDNGKNPRLGYLNQTPELAEITAFLSAAGLGGKQIHLILNQPAVVELVRRMKEPKKNFNNVSDELIRELLGGGDKLLSYNGHLKSAEHVLAYKEADWEQTIPIQYSELKTTTDMDIVGHQISLLRVLKNLYRPASDLSEIVKNTRPEATSSGIGSTLAETIAITNELDKVREKVLNSETGPSIIGFEGILGARDIYYDDSVEDVYKKIATSELRQVTALQNLMQDQVYTMLSRYFPMARRTWRNVIVGLASRYVPDGAKLRVKNIQRVGEEMILWDLQHSKGFVQDIEAERKELLSTMPNKLMKLKERIKKEAARRDRGEESQDKVAYQLIDNIFLNHLFVEKPEGPKMKPRIMFNKGGAEIGGLAEAVTYDWMTLYLMNDQECKDLAIDLYKYNTFTNGFGYGMYEFAHFVPYPIIAKVPGYLDALRGIQSSYEFTTSMGDLNRFVHQHYANHWSDENLVPRTDAKHLPETYRLLLGMKPLKRIKRDGEEIDPNYNSPIIGKPYFLYAGKVDPELFAENVRKHIGEKTTLFAVNVDENGNVTSIIPAPKLGVTTDRNQVSVQYNHELEVFDMEPFQVGLDSVWGDFQDLTLANSDPANLDDTSNQSVSDEDAEAYANSAFEYGERQTPANYSKQVQRRAKNVSSELAAAVEAIRKSRAALKETTQEASDNGAQEVVSTEQMLLNVIKGKKGQQNASPVQSSTADEDFATVEEGAAYTAYQEDGYQPDDVDAPARDGQVMSGYNRQRSNAIRIINAEEGELGGPEEMLYIATTEEKEDALKIVEKRLPVTPDNIRLARKQRAYVELSKKLRAILESKGISVGVLDNLEARIEENWGLTNFDALKVGAEGLKELIKVAEGYRGDVALPEEFAHTAIEMLGHDDPLVRRLLNLLENDEEQMRAAFGDTYEEYERFYEGDMQKMALEAAGKLVSQALLKEQIVTASKTRSLIRRIVDKIKDLLKRIGWLNVQEAILDAHQVSSQLARDILSGQLVDMMDIKNIKAEGQMPHIEKVTRDLSNKTTLLDRIMQQENKRLSILQRKLAHSKDDKTNPAVVATQKQIDLLEAGLRNHKIESTITEYLNNSLKFLRETEASLDKYINSGYKVNSICRKLNTIRDTIFSYRNVLDILNKADAAGEISLSKELKESISEVTLEVGRFQQEYEMYGMTFFERMLVNVYGEHGITRTLGKKKGQQYTPEEMARRADRDVNMMNRWLSSLADTGDPVLAAIDWITRQAKLDGRRRTASIVPKLNEAFERLKRDTGSTDQTFMFEYKTDASGKRTRTGLYISSEDAEKLTPAQKHFYDTIMEIKKEVDECLPPSVIRNPRQIIAMRKYGFDRIKDANGISGKWEAFVENVRNSILDTSDNIEYEKEVEIKDFQNNRVDMLPIHYVNKGKHETWDDMTEDVAQSLLAYAGMGFEYNELNNVTGILENARYMSMNREVEQHKGIKQIVERIVSENGNETLFQEKPSTVPQSRTNIQGILNDFFTMQIYGQLQKQEGTFGHTRISKRKVANFVNALASYNQMALNIPQRISNVTAGMSNIIIETAGKGVFNAGDFAWGLKEYIKNLDRVLDTGRLESDNKLSLFAEKFDLHQSNGKKYKNYRKGALSRVVNTNLLFAGLNAGEDLLALTTALAIARRHKVKAADGSITNLWDAYEVKYANPTKFDKDGKAIAGVGAHLELKKGYTEMDGSPIDAKVEDAYGRLVIGTNFRLQGIYNNDDKAAIHQYALGSLVMMYRKWIHPSLQRRYGQAGYNPLTGTEGEGYWRTFGGWIGDSMKEASETIREERLAGTINNVFDVVKAYGASMSLNWSKMSDYEKSNMRRAFTEMGILLTVTLAIYLLDKLPPDDDKKNKTWANNMLVYQLYRARNEIGSVAPTPLIFKEVENTLSSPIAAWKPVHNLLQLPLALLPSNMITEAKSGPYKGHSRSFKIIMDMPVLSMYKQFQHLLDPSSLINYYKSGK